MRSILAKPSPALVVAVVALIAATGGWAVAAIPSSNGTITACYAKSGGAVRVVDAKKKCKRSEKRLAFNQKGRDGKDGAAGTPGTPGQNGTNGANGTNGTNGTDATIPPVEERHVVGQAGQPGFQAPWTTSMGFAAPTFWKDRDGVVHLEGDSFRSGGPNTAFETIFTLPASYRPASNLRFTVPTVNSGVGGDTATFTTLRIQPNGQVAPEVPNISGGTLTMDGVTFRAEQ